MTDHADGTRMGLPATLNEDLYDLRSDNLGHWWACLGCGRRSGIYASKRSARASAERHHDNGKCTREHL